MPFAAAIRERAGIATGAVGLITEPAQAEAIVAAGQADSSCSPARCCATRTGRSHAAQALGAEVEWPVQYLRARP